MVKKTLGRQKIEMVKIKDESNLQVTFSKRRSGLFKKASELCTLCGVEIAIIVFSPGNKVFSFGHPDVENILNRYVHNTKDTSPTWQLIEAHRNAIILRLNAQLTEMMSQIEAQKKRGEELDKMRKASQEQNWWESPIEELSLPQLQFLRSAMAELKKIVQREAEQLIIQNTNCQQLFPGSSSQGTNTNSKQFFIGSSSQEMDTNRQQFFPGSSSQGMDTNPQQFFTGSSSQGMDTNPQQFFTGSSSQGMNTNPRHPPQFFSPPQHPPQFFTRSSSQGMDTNPFTRSSIQGMDTNPQLFNEKSSQGMETNPQHPPQFFTGSSIQGMDTNPQQFFTRSSSQGMDTNPQHLPQFFTGSSIQGMDTNPQQFFTRSSIQGMDTNPRQLFPEKSSQGMDTNPQQFFTGSSIQEMDRNPSLFFIGSSSQGGTPNYETMNNNMALNANRMGGEYIDPNMIAPTPNYNPNPPAEGHIYPNPEGSDILAPTSPGFGSGLF
ncbi:hypothetical protein ERO13_D01G171950v2 [Gossypium hirsutum]|uniref:Agamous-like MADS-box protein AGL66 n=5 Tax=Gossypium TaxID=3633 RepID=A0A1U8KWT2_GOSHI|nr:agamous-like MADS-box protein AGL66 [Gossypium hirsutum]KAB2046078.1 hypothetical protein ES319_D01G207800v1 [Gossypium barbadense]KAG4163451.1 hypothetical protein ERO13_D01G171950v2 [Gossypium hirsutum]TYG84099.1 hypothetical protein ES288_D01G222600v1 [Gossypium darwinii]TYH88945.1 hypothetical protein ES332_D01G224300v1 [Gossypium tomentosum]